MFNDRQYCYYKSEMHAIECNHQSIRDNLQIRLVKLCHPTLTYVYKVITYNTHYHSDTSS